MSENVTERETEEKQESFIAFLLRTCSFASWSDWAKGIKSKSLRGVDAKSDYRAVLPPITAIL